MPAVNLDKLWTLVSEQTKEKYKNHPEKKVPVIDCVRAVSIHLYFNYLPAHKCLTVIYFDVKVEVNKASVGCA